MGKISEMEKVAYVLDLYQLPKTAKTIRSLSNDLHVTRINVDFEQAFRKIEKTLEIEFISNSSTNPTFGRKLYNGLTALENSSSQTNATLKGKRINDFYDSMVRIGNSYVVIGDVAKNFMNNRRLTLKQKYYAECFNYLLIVEGVFKELCEYILMLDDLRKRHSRTLSKIEKLRLSDLVKEMKTKRDISVFADGYDNHLRNAIAHANFKFDENTQKMTFRDEYKGKTHSLSLTIEEFAQYHLKIDDVYRLITSFWELLRIVTIHNMA